MRSTPSPTRSVARTGSSGSGVRHEEVAAFAAGAQAQLTGRLAVCMGTVGPGAIHLLNGLYDAKKSHAPVLAIIGQVPREDMGSDFFQEVDNDVLFADVAVFCETVTSLDQLPFLIEQAGNAAIAQRGVAVLTLPGDVGGLDLPEAHGPAPVRRPDLPVAGPTATPSARPLAALNAAGTVTLLVGQGALHARDEVLAARRPAGRADGADPQGQAGARGPQRLRDRPVRSHRQPRHGQRLLPLRPAAAGSKT